MSARRVSRAPPHIVVERSAEALREAVAEVLADGWHLVRGWRAPPGPRRSVCVGRVESAEDASSALLAAVAGSGVVVDARADRDIIDRLCDDLRRLGRVDYRVAPAAERPALSTDEWSLLDRLLAGRTLGQAARELNVSRRTADRRLAAARRALGASSTAQALAAFARRRPDGGSR